MFQREKVLQSQLFNTCVGLSFCCISFNPVDFSLEQNMLVVLRQAFKSL